MFSLAFEDIIEDKNKVRRFKLRLSPSEWSGQNEP